MTNKAFEEWWNKYGEFPDNRYMCQEIFEAGQKSVMLTDKEMLDDTYPDESEIKMLHAKRIATIAIWYQQGYLIECNHNGYWGFQDYDEEVFLDVKYRKVVD